MKSLGKIVVFLIFISFNTLYAGVVAKVDSKSVSLGEMVTLNLVISGEDVSKPNLYKICGYDIESSSSQTSIRMINLDYQKNYILSYKFTPQKSCLIDAIEVEIDGKTEKTEPINIEVKAVSKTVDSNFELLLRVDKKELFVGESVDLILFFRQKKNTSVVDSKFRPPELKGFWVKGESEPQRYSEGEYTVTKIIYTIAPQREGSLEITPAQMKIATRSKMKDSWDSWRPNIKWRAYFSNNIKFQVSPLPVGLSLVGDFSMEAVVDKTEINPNEAINLTLTLRGKGNFEDVESFKPYIKGVSVFDEKIVLTKSGLTQKIAFVSDEDFTIPSFSLRFFNPKTKEIKTIKSKEIQIKVNGSAKKELVLKRDNSSDEGEVKVVKATQEETQTSALSTSLLAIIFFIGLIAGIAITLTKPWLLFKREKTLSIKDPKLLLVKLMPYKSDVEVEALIEILEKNIYSNAGLEIDKKLVKELILKYELT